MPKGPKSPPYAQGTTPAPREILAYVHLDGADEPARLALHESICSDEVGRGDSRENILATMWQLRADHARDIVFFDGPKLVGFATADRVEML